MTPLSVDILNAGQNFAGVTKAYVDTSINGSAAFVLQFPRIGSGVFKLDHAVSPEAPPGCARARATNQST